MIVRDPGFAQKVLHLLQARGTSPAVTNELGLLGFVVTIPAADVLENAAKAPQGFEVVTLANPAAGADWTFVVPSDRIWVPQLLKARLTTAVAAANRAPLLEVRDAAATLVTILEPKSADSVGAVQPASRIFDWSWARLLGGAAVLNTGDGVSTQALPDLVLPPGFQLGMRTIVLQAADQWSAIIMLVQSLRAT